MFRLFQIVFFEFVARGGRCFVNKDNSPVWVKYLYLTPLHLSNVPTRISHELIVFGLRDDVEHMVSSTNDPKDACSTSHNGSEKKRSDQHVTVHVKKYK